METPQAKPRRLSQAPRVDEPSAEINSSVLKNQIKRRQCTCRLFGFHLLLKYTYKGTIVLYILFALEKTGKQSNLFIYEKVRVYAMSREKVEQASLNQEDLVIILETAKEIGTKNQEINTMDFVTGIKKQLIKAMGKRG